VRRRNLLALTLCLAVSACQPPSYRILAHQDRYQLILTPRGSGAWPFRSEEGIEAVTLTVRDRNRYLWAIEQDPDQPGCRSPTGTPPFPVAYGSTVPCFRTIVGPQSLGSGGLFRVDGIGTRRGIGFFRYEPIMGGGVATNLVWEDVSGEVSGWPSLPEPRGGGQANSKTSAAPAAADTNAVSANKP